MDEKDLKQVLHDRRRQVFRRGWRCPDEAKIAAYVDHQIEGSPASQSIEAHLADCDYCLEQVSFLAQSAEWTNFDTLPPQLLSRARNLVPRRLVSTTTWGWRWAMPAVAAACLVLMVALIGIFLRTRQRENVSSEPLVAQQHQPETVTVPEMKPTAPARLVPKPKSVEAVAPTLRSGARELMPTLVSPQNGETVQRNKLQFRWESLADAQFYEIRVVTAEGDPVFEAKTEDTQLGIGKEVQLQAGAKYFVSVRAHLRQGKTVKSSIVSFRIL